ncbi:MAG: TonB-dependent receptor [Alphaproteobacteria bacterium]|nr:TonB-dependent receptor [Alphaproteobacteria bacterium]
MSKVRSLFALVTGASAAALTLAAPAMAQQQAPAKPQASGLEEIVVTAEKREASIQDVPIAVSAFSQDALQAAQISGGPNLQLAIPNVNFSKGNFTGYNFQIRGVGSKLVAASGDAATGIHLNGSPLTANNLFEAEFYDVERVEVLRGPQGTLYGRNATGGVVNVITAKPGYEFRSLAQGAYGSDNTTRIEGMVDIPFSDNAGLRIAAAQLKRDGYVQNLITRNDIDGRDLWSLRATLGIDFTDNARGWFSYEHFSEDDTRLRSGKQLCIKDPAKTSVGGVAIAPGSLSGGFLSQGCAAGNQLNSRDTVNSSATLGGLLGNLTGLITGDAYGSKQVPRDLRTIEAAFDPIYRANSDVYTLNFTWDLTDALTLTSLTGHSQSSVFSNEDYNKVSPLGAFNPNASPLFPGGVVNDPQLGASNTFRTYDISRGSSEQTTSELRLQSNFDGKLNFNVGGIALRYKARADYYVFSNTLSGYAQLINAGAGAPVIPLDTSNPNGPTIESRVDDSGRNYFLSRSPYELNAWAGFGEAYYKLTDALKFTLGVRYTSDDKSQQNNFTALLTPITAVPLSATAPTNAYLSDPKKSQVSFGETTGRAGIDWKPDLGFTDETLVYLFLSKGYKGGGINPPSAVGVAAIKPTFEPEFVNAVEVGTKNTLNQGRLQLNATYFNYDYTGYQVSKIVNRTSLNENIDAKIWGLEFEGNWAPIDRVLLTLNAGYLNTEITNGESIDLLNRTQGRADLTLVKTSAAANCVVPTRGVAAVQAAINAKIPGFGQTALLGLCPSATAPNGSFSGLDAATLAFLNSVLQAQSPGAALKASDLVPFEGIPVALKGKELPNSPQMTVSLAAQYTQPVTDEWKLVFRGDYYWQDASWSRIYNTSSDIIPSWENANFSVSLDNEAHQLSIKAFVKNAFNKDAITDKYLTDDSSGLFTNVFLIEPRTYGVTVSKKF